MAYLKTKNKKDSENVEHLDFLDTYTKEELNAKTLVLIIPYSMVGNTKRIAALREKMLNFINGHEWGLMLLDEV